MVMDKADWYTKGFEEFGWRVRLAMWLIRLMYKLRLISEEDVKRYTNAVINAWLLEKARKNKLEVSYIEF